jgi:PKD repeat protein
LAVTFTNLSSGATNYSWAFGDGNLSSSVNPTNTYSNAGTYSVMLTAVGPGGTNVLTRTNYIVVVAPVVAGFTGGSTNGVAPLTVSFTNLSSGATNYSWAFGDGNLSSNANPTNTYSSPGTYSVTLTAVGPGGTNVLTRTNYIVVVAPVVAGFTGSPTNGLAPLTVTFTNQSSGASEFTWAFGDGNVSTNANPVNTYSNAGTYSVKLMAVGAGGTNTLTRTNYIVVVAPVAAGFTGGPTNGVAPLTVSFTNLSSGATNYSWAFGDGHLSTNTNTSNTYSNAGTYSVTLTAIGAGGTNAFTRTNYIAVTLRPSDLLLVNPLLSPNRTFQFAVSNVDGTPISTAQQSNIEIHASADLRLPFPNWLVLTNATLLTNGLLQVTDPNSALSAERFYRAVQRP